jgi:nucleotide-binding universal stress UspA family protein
MTIKEKEIILAATDFSAAGDFAIDNATHLSTVMHSKLSILHVINAETKAVLEKENRSSSGLEKKLAEISGNIKRIHSIETTYLTKEGSIFSAIPDACRELKATFLFIGLVPHKGKRLFRGSPVMKIIKSSPVPVFVLQKASAGNKFQQIVYPLDTDVGSKQKIKWAVHLNKFAGSNIHIFVDHPTDKDTQVKLRADLHQLEGILEQHGTTYTVTHSKRRGPFSKQIITFAKDKDADAIMISTDPDKISWALIRTAEEKIIYNKEKIPVICVNTKDFKRIIGGL